jgi:hypothetical protein
MNQSRTLAAALALALNQPNTAPSALEQFDQRVGGATETLRITVTDTAGTTCDVIFNNARGTWEDKDGDASTELLLRIRDLFDSDRETAAVNVNELSNVLSSIDLLLGPKFKPSMEMLYQLVEGVPIYLQLRDGRIIEAWSLEMQGTRRVGWRDYEQQLFPANDVMRGWTERPEAYDGPAYDHPPAWLTGLLAK